MIDHNLQDLGGGTASGLLAHRAALMPDKQALLFEDEVWSYRELDDAVTRIAGGLIALGLGKGDRVASLMNNRSEYLTVGLGLNRAALVSVPLNNAFMGAFLRNPLDRTHPVAIVTESVLAGSLASVDQLPDSVRVVVFVDDVPRDWAERDIDTMTLAQLEALGEQRTPPLPDIGAGDVSAILFTSGTTGGSKGVVCPNLMGVTMAKEHAEVFEITPRDRMFTCFPMYHGMAQVATCLTAIYAGATAILRPGFDLTNFWDDVRRYEATQFNALGVVLALLLAMPENDQDRAHKVTRVFSAPAPADVLYRFEDRFGVHLIEGYGQTETKNIMYNSTRARKIGSMGLPTPTSIVEVHDENGVRVSPGEVGEIVYRPTTSNISCLGYLNDDEATLKASRGLWWHTGDMGSQDPDGYFYFFDRKSDSLRRRGENISSVEVEDVLAAYPGVQMAAAIHASSELGESEVLVVLQVAEGTQIDYPHLWQFCVDRMPRFMVPRYYRTTTSIPITATGKIRKVELRDAYPQHETWDSLAEGYKVPKPGQRR